MRAVSVLLKIARKKGVHIEHAIAVNYIVATACCWFLLAPPLDSLREADIGGLWPFLALGVLLPSIFVVMARAVEQAGIVRSDAAQRLSLVLPVLAASWPKPALLVRRASAWAWRRVSWASVWAKEARTAAAALLPLSASSV